MINWYLIKIKWDYVIISKIRNWPLLDKGRSYPAPHCFHRHSYFSKGTTTARLIGLSPESAQMQRTSTRNKKLILPLDRVFAKLLQTKVVESTTTIFLSTSVYVHCVPWFGDPCTTTIVLMVFPSHFAEKPNKFLWNGTILLANNAKQCISS